MEPKQLNKDKHKHSDLRKTLRAILPKDDAFHGSLKHIAAEWWYFDAIFSNDYSVHVGIKTYTKKHCGFISLLVEIYNKGKLQVKTKKTSLFKKADVSNEIPTIVIDNIPIIAFNQKRFHETTEWVYHVYYTSDACKIDLEFLGTTKGWVFETKAENWIVALPKARVNGEIIINNKTIQVNGVGYHDHNWNYTILTVMNYGTGWYWGKIASKSLNAVWAKIEKSSGNYKLYIVVNRDDDGFYHINPKQVSLTFDTFIRSHLHKIPTRIYLKIDDVVKTTPIHVDVTMEVYGLHYSNVIIAPYWRYHVRSTGTISIGAQKEQVNASQIIELLKFS